MTTKRLWRAYHPIIERLLLYQSLLRRDRERLAEFCVQHRIASMFAVREFADAGGLVSYGPDFPAIFRRVADYVDRIAKGAKAADLPVEQPTKFELVINLKTAKAIGLDIPDKLMGLADAVVE
jgi:putative ABC transport system substrate-binding protein